MPIRSVNPANEKVIKTFKPHSLKDINGKIELAAGCYDEWKKYAISVRSKVLKRAAEILEDRKQHYAELMTMEMGKPIRESIAEVEKCAWVCNYYAEHAKLFLKDDVIQTDAEKSLISYEPLGVILAVMPWNFPFWQVFRFAAPTLMAGNTALLKHASNVPQCALAVEEVFTDAEGPEGLFQTLLIGGDRVKKILQNDHVKAVSLTGSEDAGSKVAAAASGEIKKSVLELGGSDPFIVLREANLKKAAKVGVQSRMINTGQSCIAAKRFIVERSVIAPFIKLVKDEIKAMTIGNPMDEKNKLGPMAREDLLKAVHEQVKISVKKGAKLTEGGERINRKGYFYKPTLLTGVKPGMPCFDEEVFGPVASVIEADDEDHAIELANLSSFGLGASIWSENKENALRLARLVESGNVFINGLVRSDPRLPFGGIKKSGYGRELSEHGIKEFVNAKTIVLEG